MSDSNVTLVSEESLTRFTKDVFCALGLSQLHSGWVAQSLVEADLRGVETHGVSKIPLYVKRIQSGVIDPRGEPTIVKESPGTALVDGKNAMGQVVGTMAMDLCVHKAKSHGIAMVVARNSNHFGTCAYYTMRALQHDMIGVASSNGVPAIAPFGGTTPLLSNNPVSVAVPAKKRLPIVLDISTSVVAQSKIIMAAKRGEKIPLGWATNLEGEDTDDPEVALKGLLCFMAGYKGYGLTVVLEALSGVLAGGLFSKQVRHIMEDFTLPQGVSHFFIAINVQEFMEISEFKSRMDEFAEWIKGSKRAKGVEEVYLPGEIEYRKQFDRKKNGIPMSRDILADLQKVAQALKVRTLSNL